MWVCAFDDGQTVRQTLQGCCGQSDYFGSVLVWVLLPEFTMSLSYDNKAMASCKVGMYFVVLFPTLPSFLV